MLFKKNIGSLKLMKKNPYDLGDDMKKMEDYEIKETFQSKSSNYKVMDGKEGNVYDDPDLIKSIY